MKKKIDNSKSKFKKPGLKGFFDTSNITHTDEEEDDYENEPGYQAKLLRAKEFLRQHPPPGCKPEDFI